MHWKQHVYFSSCRATKSPPPGVFMSKQQDTSYFQRFIILSLTLQWLLDFLLPSPWLWLERWETHKQGVCCYLAHRNKTQATPPLPLPVLGGLMGKWVSEEIGLFCNGSSYLSSACVAPWSSERVGLLRAPLPAARVVFLTTCCKTDALPIGLRAEWQQFTWS